MPTLSMFYGIIIRMYAEKGGQHNIPHIHAAFSGHEIVVDLTGNIIEGGFPKGKLKLEANWKLLCDGELAFKIEPLK